MTEQKNKSHELSVDEILDLIRDKYATLKWQKPFGSELLQEAKTRLATLTTNELNRREDKIKYAYTEYSWVQDSSQNHTLNLVSENVAHEEQDTYPDFWIDLQNKAVYVGTGDFGMSFSRNQNFRETANQTQLKYLQKLILEAEIKEDIVNELYE